MLLMILNCICTHFYRQANSPVRLIANHSVVGFHFGVIFGLNVCVAINAVTAKRCYILKEIMTMLTVLLS